MRETLHQFNIYTHILFGSLAMLVGLWPIFTPKGKRKHKRTGKLYLLMVCGVLVTALFGALFFNFRPFLFLLTILVFYTSFVGYRTLKLKERKPEVIDRLVNVLGFSTVGFYFFLFDIDAAAMSKPVVYATAFVLLLHVVYDFGKNFYSQQWLRRTWLNDHIIRIISSFGGLICAFAGNVLDESYQPYSQILPSVVGYVLIAYFIFKFRNYLNP
ncbi:MAG: putative membrane protein [Psychromonas sp.]|jgi:uncharacterized membrane protein